MYTCQRSFLSNLDLDYLPNNFTVHVMSHGHDIAWRYACVPYPKSGYPSFLKVREITNAGELQRKQHGSAHLMLCVTNALATSLSLSQKSSNMERVSMSWRHVCRKYVRDSTNGDQNIVSPLQVSFSFEPSLIVEHYDIYNNKDLNSSRDAWNDQRIIGPCWMMSDK